MNTISKQLKTTIAMVSACLACAFIALVALFATAGGLDKLGTSVLLGILVAFVAVGSAVIVDEYKSEQHANELRGMSYTLNAVREMRDEYADTLASMEADYRDELHNTKRLSAEVQDVRNSLRRTWVEKYNNNNELNAQLANAKRENAEQLEEIYNLKQSIAELAEELDEIRYAVKAERERVADI